MMKIDTSTPDDIAIRIETTAERYYHLILPSILCLALFVRVIALLDLKQTLYFDFMLWDERLYHEWAKKISDGTFASGEVYEFAPVPAYLIAGIYKLFSPDIVYIRYVNIILGVVTCWLAYLTGREISGRAVGLTAAFFTALYKPFIFYNIVPLKSTMTIVLFAALIYFLCATFSRGRPYAALLVGFFMGLANNVRPNVVVLVPLIPVLMIWIRFRGKATLKPVAILLAMYAAGLGLMHAPFMIRNYQVAGQAAPVTSQAGFHIYMCNQYEYPKGIPFVTTSPTERGIQFTIEASRREGHKLNSKEASDYWTRQALRSVIANPGKYILSQLDKLRKILSSQEKGEHYHVGFMSDFAPFFKLPFLAFWFIMPLGMAGMLFSLPGSKKTAALLLVFTTYTATLVLFFSSARMRMPLVVMLLPFAGLGLKGIITAAHARNKRGLVLYLAVITAFTGISFWPRESAPDLTGYLNTHAIILQTNGKTSEAARYWEQSSRSEGKYAAFANLSLSGLYARRGDQKKARAYLDRIRDDSFAAALKYESIGDLLLSTGQVRAAIEAYEQSLAINSGLRRIRMKLVKVLERINPGAARLEYAKLLYINSFYNLYGSKTDKHAK